MYNLARRAVEYGPQIDQSHHAYLLRDIIIIIIMIIIIIIISIIIIA